MDAKLKPRVVPVIMSGGAGTRLWPLSTEAAPKQFHALASKLSMIQETALRVLPNESVSFLPPIIICAEAHGELAATQLHASGVEPWAVVLEPYARNTAAVAAVAARLSQELNPQALTLLLPADHVISDSAAFSRAVAAASAAAVERIVTFGVTPASPETGYGYIRLGPEMDDAVFEVSAFTEKPARDTAAQYVASGEYLWNSGIFLFTPAVMLREIHAFRPDVHRHALAALDSGGRDGLFIRLDPQEFAACPADSIDFAVMEQTQAAAVSPFDGGWADLGSWSELWRLGAASEADNVVKGEVVLVDSSGCLVFAEDRPVAAMELRDLIVVSSKAGVIVLPRHRAQDVKTMVEQLKARSALASPEGC